MALDESDRRVVHCSTDPELAGWCPKCQQQSSSPKERVTTRPRDLRIGPDRPVLLCTSGNGHCRVPQCERKGFTEALGIDETRRGKGRYEVESSTDVKVSVDRFDTGLVDLADTGRVVRAGSTAVPRRR